MKLRTTLALLGSALLLAGCSSSTDGIAAPAPSSSVPDNTTPPYAGAPKVQNPLPDSVISGDPCQDAFTPEQLKVNVGTGITGEPDNVPGSGPACIWADRGAFGGLLKIYFTTAQKRGLSAYYDQTKNVMKRFDVLPLIQGFPAVAYSDKPGPVSPFCQVAVGISDTADFVVSLDVSTKSTADACQIAAEIAGDVATTLKQKAEH